MKKLSMLTHTSAIAISFGFFLSWTPAQAEDLHEKLNRIINNHVLVETIDREARALEHQVSAEESRWLPTLSVNAAKGGQRYDRDNVSTDGGTANTTEASVGFQQLVWDFGATNSAIRKAELTLHKKGVERDLQVQNLLLAGIEAHLRLRKAWELVRYARASEQNVVRQAQMESSRVEAGKGYSTDVLQAKATLSMAQARRIAAEGDLSKMVNRYHAVFGDDGVDPAALENINLPASLLPASLEALMARVEQSNPDLQRSRELVAVADVERDLVEQREWAPVVNLVGDHTHNKNIDGYAGRVNDSSVKLKVSWSFDVGLRAASAVNAAAANASAERSKSHYVSIQAVEEARNAWDSLQTAQQRSRSLKEQMDLQSSFLELARKERELGRRSLLDVLNGETQLLNAQADYEASQIDVVLSAYRIIRAYGGIAADQV